MCHSSVIIRKHIDLTITLEQHSPAPQSRYLSPGGTWSDEVGLELFLGLCFTPYAVFAPPLAPLFFCSPLSFLFFSLCPPYAPSPTSTQLPVPFASASALGSRQRTGTSAAQPQALQTRQQLQVSPIAFSCTPGGSAGHTSLHPLLTGCEGCSQGSFPAEAVVVTRGGCKWGCLWTWKVGLASSPPKACEQLNLLI